MFETPSRILLWLDKHYFDLSTFNVVNIVYTVFHAKLKINTTDILNWQIMVDTNSYLV